MRDIIERIDLHDDHVVMVLRLSSLTAGVETSHYLSFPVQRMRRGHLADMMRISYLAPDIITAIVEGRQPASLKRKTLMATPLSLDWSEQHRQLGFA